MDDLVGRRLRLFEQLTSYKPLAEEEPARALMCALAQTPEDPLSRHRFDPGHFTVGAYVLADDHLLMVHHRRLDRWLAPGGHVDPEDKSLETAAARELLEETGIVGDLADAGIFDVDAHPIPEGKGEPPHTHFNIGYLFTAELAVPVAAAEVRAADWIPLSRVGDMAPDGAIRRVTAKLRAL